jgi:23S rRNA (adenine2503-C2)-methyltransferase
MSGGRETLLGLFPEELNDSLELEKGFRGRQLFRRLHLEGSRSFEEMTELPAALRRRLDEQIGSPLVGRVVASTSDEDGTVKLALQSQDDIPVECVLLQDRQGRKTACLSSQIGCGMGCRFCRTAEMGFYRQLSAGEILEQLAHLRELYGKIDNVVFMGMGEPLANLPRVQKAVELMRHREGLGMSLRRITVSTCGLVDGIRRLTEEGPRVRLALSLITADQKKREELMPIAAANPLPRLYEALADYRSVHKRRITLEYVAIGGVNTGTGDAEKLAAFAKPLRAQVNIIPWNPVDGLPFKEPSRDELHRLIAAVEELGIPVSRRLTRGRGVNGACGQLATGLG